MGLTAAHLVSHIAGYHMPEEIVSCRQSPSGRHWQTSKPPRLVLTRGEAGQDCVYASSIHGTLKIS